MDPFKGNRLTPFHSKALDAIFLDEKYSDLIIASAGLGFRVHKAILCPMSSVIAAAIDHEWQESKLGMISQTEFDPFTISRMLLYVYYGDYDLDCLHRRLQRFMLMPSYNGRNEPVDSNDHASVATETTVSKPDTDSKPLLSTNQAKLLHVRVHAIGEYYDMTGLKELAWTKFSNIHTDVDDAAGFIALVDTISEMLPSDDTRFYDAVCEDVKSYVGVGLKDKLIIKSFESNPNMARITTTLTTHFHAKSCNLSHECDKLVKDLSLSMRREESFQFDIADLVLKLEHVTEQLNRCEDALYHSRESLQTTATFLTKTSSAIHRLAQGEDAKSITTHAGLRNARRRRRGRHNR